MTNEEVMMDEKQLRWQEVQQQFSQTTDRLGMPIDGGIFETVVCLNILGIVTRQSCEGHLGRARPAPWVTFTTPGVSDLYKEAAAAHKQARDASKERSYSYEELTQLFAPAHQLREEADAKHAVDQQKVIDYLTQFYAERHVPYDCMLIVYSDIAGISTLESQGAPLQVLQPPEVKAQKLLEYQQEMQAFAAFLKHCYFQA